MKEGIYIMLNDDSTFLVRVEGTSPYLKVATVLDLKEFEKGEVKKVKLTDPRVKSLMTPGTIYKPVIADQSYSGYDNVIKEETISTERVSVWKAHYTAMGKVSTLIKIVQDTGWELKNAEAYFNQNIG